MTAGTDSVNQDCDGMTALHLAAKYATVPAILQVIFKAVDDCSEAEQILAIKSALKQNPLHVAAKIPSETSEAFRLEHSCVTLSITHIPIIFSGSCQGLRMRRFLMGG